MQSRPIRTIHSADCDVWDAPDQSTVPVTNTTVDATAAYLAAAAPIYIALSRVTGQLAGLLLLSMHRSTHGLQLDHTLYQLARDQLAEVNERRSILVAPRGAARHLWAIGKAVKTLQQVLLYMDRPPAERDARHQLLIRLLRTAHKLLHLTAQPRAGLCLVDFDHACCSCANHGPATLRVLPRELN